MKIQQGYKLLLCALCLVILLLPHSIEAYAAESAVIAVGHETGEQGERISIPVTLSANPGLAYLRITVEYDTSRLRIDNVGSVMQGDALPRLSYFGVSEDSYNQNPFRVLWFGTANDTSTGVLLDIIFTVLENAPAGEAVISVAVDQRDAYDRNGIIVPVSATSGAINVLADDGEPDEPQEPTEPPTDEPTELPYDDESTPEDEDNAAPEDDNEQENNEMPQEGEQAPTPTPSPGQPNSPTTPIFPPTVPTVVEPQNVDPQNLPPEIQDVVEGNLIFTAESPDEEESVRVLMSIPYTAESGIMREILVAYRIDAEGEIELIIPSLYDESQSAMRVLGYTGELYMVATNLISFNDVSRDAWYHRAITFAAAREIFSGVGNNQFAPQLTMTRAMFITALSRLDDADTSVFAISPFADVNIENWYGAAIAWAYSEGIISEGILSGGAMGTFRPSDNITREDMAVIFANYLAIRDFPLVELDVPEFYDIYQASPWARDAIQAMRRHSIISGVGGNRYNPASYASRAEVAQIFTNIVRAIVGLSR